MFSRLFKKTVETSVPDAPATPSEKFDLHISVPGRFAIPQWDKVEAALGTRLAAEDPNVIWSKVAESWLDDLRAALGGRFRVEQSANFLLLSACEKRQATVFLEYAEKTKQRVLRLLGGIARDDGYGKSCIIVFADNDQYYEYVANYYPDEGEFAFSSGMYINRGYGHFVCVQDEMRSIEPVIAHEMTHMHLSHLPLPLWLDEGLAVNTEHALSPRPTPTLDMLAEVSAKHGAFWNEDTMQQFWSGESFGRSDDGNMLSYDLAQKITTVLSQDRERFVWFVNAVTFEDGGQQAAHSCFGAGLEDVVNIVIGEGPWSPQPNTWHPESDRAQA